MFELRQHQQDALDAVLTSEEGIGRIVIPTGGGKTCVEAYALREFINEDARDIHIVLAPRIALVNQLIKEYRSFIGQNYIALAFHSGRHEPDYEKVKWTERATTTTDVVDEEFARAQRMGKDLVIFSTYASVHKLLDYQFDTLIADESQYCVAENHFETVRDMDSRRKFFFTATEKHTVTTDGRGLNNEEVFGDVLYQVAPATLIELGYIVAPRLHVMSCTRDDNVCTVMDEVMQIAKKQSELSVGMPVNKILFAMKGTSDVTKVAEKKNIEAIKAEMPGYKVFTIVSNAKYGAMVDGKKMGRGDFFKVLRECDNALIFHYDILSEGIDVDGITGVALMRNMGHAKLLQTIGRAVRIYKANPSAKKQAWVSVMTVNGNDESSSHLERVVRLIRDGGFEVNAEEVEFTDNEGFGIAEEDDLDDVVSADSKSAAKAALENVMHSIEQNEFFKSIRTASDADLEEFFS
jgi:superfamily II DNA or RNA helicase